MAFTENWTSTLRSHWRPSVRSRKWTILNRQSSLTSSPTGRWVIFSRLLPLTLTLPQDVEKIFPNLFCLAMDILPAQASSVPCERLFSSGKETCTARWNRIQPKLMEALQALKLSSRNCSLDLTEHLSSKFQPPEDELEVCDTLEAVYNTEESMFQK